MKKIVTIIITLLFFTGCTLFESTTSPTRSVEDLFGKYQSLDAEVLSQLDDVIANEDLTTAQQDEYKRLMKKQYQNLTYVVKDEVIDGNNATVTVEVEVYDLVKAQTAVDAYLEENRGEFEDQEGAFLPEKYTDYKLEQLEKVKDRAKYTIDVGLTKIDDKWELDDLSEADRQKIHGIYQST